MKTVLQNARYSFRQLWKNPGFALVAIITLALGIGANTAIFSVLYASLLAPMPYPDSDRLVMLWSKVDSRNTVSAGDYIEWKGDSLAERRFSMILLGAFAALALLLASVGIYGVISYVVGQRTHEIGIRMALGARRLDILRLILSGAGKLTLIGIAIGLVSALGLTRLMANLLYGVGPSDPLTFIAVPAILISVALLASYLPARRATRVDPMTALRYE
jgi:ABC-type antimicrobial peptide transport system permease subunit